MCLRISDYYYLRVVLFDCCVWMSVYAHVFVCSVSKWRARARAREEEIKMEKKNEIN